MNDTFGFIAGLILGVITALYFARYIKRYGYDAFAHFLIGATLGFFAFQALVLFY